MARIETYERNDGHTSHRVKWRTGGSRTGKHNTVTAYDPTTAKRLALAIDEAGQHWPTDDALRALGLGQFCKTPEPEPAAEVAAPQIDYTVAVYCEMYLEAVFDSGAVKGHNRKTYSEYLDNYIAPFIGDLSMSELTAKDIRAWQRTLKRNGGVRGGGLGPKSIANIRGSVLAPALACACDADNEHDLPKVRDNNPITSVKAIKVERRYAEVIENDHEAALLLKGMYDAPYKVMPDGLGHIVSAILFGCLRLQEAVALQVKNVDFATNRIRVRAAMKRQERGGWLPMPLPKTEAGYREVPIPEALVPMYRKLCAGKSPEAYVFTSSTGGYWEYTTLYSRWKAGLALAKSYGLTKHLSLRELRHSGILTLRRKGIDIEQARQLAGHEDIGTTSRYYEGRLTDEEHAYFRGLQDAAIRESQALVGDRWALAA